MTWTQTELAKVWPDDEDSNDHVLLRVSLERRQLIASMASRIAGSLAAQVKGDGYDEAELTKGIARSSVSLAEAILAELGL
jgi:hypothetical protein